MATVIYRKYRPKNFSELKGQDHIKEILIQSIKNGTFAHGYLFAGPRGTGKTSTARIFAKAINCLNFKDDVDNTCENCELINSGTYVDIVEIDAASNRGIEEIRTLRENVNFYPSVLKKKVYIIDEAHMLTEAAFNALLKTLEEPPEYVVFILATTEPTKIPMTILSRVQRFDFRLANENSLVEKLESISKDMKLSMDDESLRLIYKMSGGSFREAESLLGKVVNETGGNIKAEKIRDLLGIISVSTLEELNEALIEKDVENAIGIFQKISSESNEIGSFVDQFMDFQTEYLLENVSDKSKSERIRSIISELINLKRDLRLFHNKDNLVEYYFIKICSDKNSQVVADKSPDVSSKKVEGIKEAKTEENKNNVSKAIAKSDSGFSSDRLIDEVRKKENRLAAFLNDTEISLNNDILKITSRNSFNLKYVEKKENSKIIIDAVEKLFQKQVRIETKLENGDDDLKIIEENNIEVKKEATEEEPETDFDNSDLVEKYL